MKIIAHRGNLTGPNPTVENHPVYILEAIDAGFDVEIDVWWIDGEWFLGHDGPAYPVSGEFIRKHQMWAHCKNIEAAEQVQYLISSFHYFYHEKDPITLTNHGYLWTFPQQKLTKLSICILPEIPNLQAEDIKDCHGICTDFPITYKERLNQLK